MKETEQMSIDVSDQPQPSSPEERRASPITRFFGELSAGLREIRWIMVLLYGIAGGILMPLSLTVGGFAGFWQASSRLASGCCWRGMFPVIMHCMGS